MAVAVAVVVAVAVAVAVVTEIAAVVAVAAADQSAEAEGGTFSKCRNPLARLPLTTPRLLSIGKRALGTRNQLRSTKIKQKLAFLLVQYYVRSCYVGRTTYTLEHALSL